MVVVLDEETRSWIKQEFGKLRGQVTLKVFTSRRKGKCLYCNEVVDLATQVSGMSELVKLELIDFDEQRELAEKHGVDKVPAIIIHGKDGYNVRFFGVPAGHEFGVFIEDIVAVSAEAVTISPDVAEIVKGINEKVHLLVFVTPTCPYCPAMVRSAHKLAILNKNITADAIESYEFPDLAEKYSVYSVPKVVINDVVEFEGAVPERFLAEKILEAVRKSSDR